MPRESGFESRPSIKQEDEGGSPPETVSYEDLLAILQKSKEVKPAAGLWGHVQHLEREETETGLKESFDLVDVTGERSCRLSVEYGPLSGNYRRLIHLNLEEGESNVDVLKFLEMPDAEVFVLSDHLDIDEREKEFEEDLNSVERKIIGGNRVYQHIMIDNLKNPSALATFFHEVGHVYQDRENTFHGLQGVKRAIFSDKVAMAVLEVLLQADDMKRIEEKDNELKNKIATAENILRSLHEGMPIKDPETTIQYFTQAVEMYQMERTFFFGDLAKIMMERDANARALKNIHLLKEKTNIDLRGRFSIPANLMDSGWMAEYREIHGLQPDEPIDVVEISFKEYLGNVCLNTYQGKAAEVKERFGTIPRLKSESELVKERGRKAAA